MFRQTQRISRSAAPHLAGAFRLALLSILAAVAAPLAFAGEIEDKVLRFSTPGIDRYADGMTVADGECYALVWSPAGKSFSGFNADGTTVSAEDRVVLAGALAQGGRCRDALFQVAAAEYEPLKDGEWAVCLVDTRRVDGVPAGVRDGRPVRVNRWGSVKGGVSVAPASAFTLPATGGTRTAASAPVVGNGAPSAGVRAVALSAVPASAPAPTITALDISDDGIATLSVVDTVPYLTYTIESSPRLGSFAIDGAADVVDGESGVEIEIATGAYGATRFFRVTRAE